MLQAEFEKFWKAFPRRTAKLAAMKAYERARRMDTEENILAGVERYKRSKPEYADWCHPATFLNQGRWMDEDDEPVTAPVKVHWSVECDELHGGTCSKQWAHEMRKRDIAV
jgi:hypothetical protein